MKLSIGELQADIDELEANLNLRWHWLEYGGCINCGAIAHRSGNGNSGSMSCRIKNCGQRLRDLLEERKADLEFALKARAYAKFEE